MATNIEIKARVSDLSKARRLARKLTARPVAILHQIDTYFPVDHGRLKLREIRSRGSRRSEIIWYRRPDRATARASEYQVVPVSNPAQIKLALSGALGVMQIVRKRRELWMYRNVRIHLDQVEKLGNFIELEAVVGGRFDRATSRRNLELVQSALGIESSMLVPLSYSDLMNRR
jgi:predicted adenylyl cyclase CyaB